MAEGHPKATRRATAREFRRRHCDRKLILVGVAALATDRLERKLRNTVLKAGVAVMVALASAGCATTEPP